MLVFSMNWFMENVFDGFEPMLMIFVGFIERKFWRKMLLRNSPGIKSEVRYPTIQPYHQSLQDWSRNWTVSSDSSFWVQEHIQVSKITVCDTIISNYQALIRTDPSKIKEICAFPKDVDEHVWQYEQLRYV